jgi:hypothetical protein
MAPAGRSSFASSVLRRVVAKLAAATPEVEAASVVSWCKRAAQDELCQFDKLLEDKNGWDYLGDEYEWYRQLPNPPRRQTEYAAAAMLQLAASINGRLALVSCGACETLVDFMLQNKVSSVHGCLYALDVDDKGRPLCIREQASDDCDCDEVSCHFHRWYVCAALALEGCASGALRLNRAGWDRHWHAVVNRDKTFEDEVTLKLKHRALMVPPIVFHRIDRSQNARMWGARGPPWCICPRGICRPGCISCLICRPRPGKYTAAAAQEDERSLCPLEEPAFLEFLDTTPGDDQAADEDEDDEDDADEDDEMASNVPASRLE